MTPARHHLRSATRETHERTDAAFSTLDLADAGDYAVFLGSHWLAYSALEPAFAATLPMAQRPPAMAALLAADLRALDVAAPALTVPAFTGDALGAAYVVAGSHFGKRVLARRQGRADSDGMRAATAYLASPALAEYWPVLQAAIEGAGPDERARMTAGADAAFALFAECLTKIAASDAFPMRLAL